MELVPHQAGRRALEGFVEPSLAFCSCAGLSSEMARCGNPRLFVLCIPCILTDSFIVNPKTPSATTALVVVCLFYL